MNTEAKSDPLPPQSPAPEDSASAGEPTFKAGEKLGGVYVLRRPLEGHPDIWLANDEVLGKDVSLHFIPAEVRKDARAMGELRQEIKRNRQLIHPNILRVYDMVEDANWAAVSMDWLEGESLLNRLQKVPEHRFSPESVADWVRQLARALDDVHKIQIVHRGISPATLFLTDGKLLIAGFGISRVIEDARSRGTKTAGAHLAYLSPQQLDGELPARTDDIYSVGATLYHLLTGSAPFSGPEIVAQVRRAAPQKMQERLGAGATIPPAWEAAVASALAKTPEERPQSMAAFVAKLGLDAAPTESAAPAAAAGAIAAAGAATETAREEKTVEPKEASARSTPRPEPRETKRSIALAGLAARPEPGSTKPGDESPATAPADQPRETGRKPKKGDAMTDAGVPDIYPSLYPKRSGFPLGTVFAILAILAIGAAIYFYTSDVDEEDGSASQGALVSSDDSQPGAGGEMTLPPTGEGAGSPDEPAITVNGPDELNTLEEGASAAPTLAGAAGEPSEPGEALPENAAPSPEASVPDEPVELPPAAANIPRVAADAPLPEIQSAIAGSESAQKDAAKQRAAAAKAVADLQAKLDKQAKDSGPAGKAAQRVLAERQQILEKQKLAAEEAEQARKAAEEKTRAAEEADKAVSKFDEANKEKLAAAEKADKELAALREQIAARQREVQGAAKYAALAAEAHEQNLAALKKAQAAAEQARKEAEAEAARKMAAERDAQRKKIEEEIEAMKRAFDEKMKALEALKDSGASVTPPPAPGDDLPNQAAAPAPPAASAPPAATPPTAAPEDTDSSLPLMAKADPPTEIPTPARSSEAPPVAPVSPVPDPAKAGSEAVAPVFESSIGLKFVPVGDVLFSIWSTRVSDFATFAKDTGLKASSWRAPGFKQGSDHPVVNVSWNDAMAFCEWLTERDRKQGLLKADEGYRLPTDLEWSTAVGLPKEKGNTPEARDMGIPDVFPWGTQWPPPPNAGNYTGEETGSDVAIKGFDDQFAWTSPVGSFPPNEYGLYDMGGNVWQWCMDSWNKESKAKVLRGASWYNGALKLSLLSSCRVHAKPDNGTDNYGFRIVKAKNSNGD